MYYNAVPNGGNSFGAPSRVTLFSASQIDMTTGIEGVITVSPTRPGPIKPDPILLIGAASKRNVSCQEQGGLSYNVHDRYAGSFPSPPSSRSRLCFGLPRIDPRHAVHRN